MPVYRDINNYWMRPADFAIRQPAKSASRFQRK
jgi:hypothetical protein